MTRKLLELKSTTRQKKRRALWLGSTFKKRKNGGFNDLKKIGGNQNHHHHQQQQRRHHHLNLRRRPDKNLLSKIELNIIYRAYKVIFKENACFFTTSTNLHQHFVGLHRVIDYFDQMYQHQ